MDYLSHSARNGFSAQLYVEHCHNVFRRAEQYARAAAKCSVDVCCFIRTVCTAATSHDLGKLLEQNQTALHQAFSGRSLPVNHVDAGSAYLFSKNALLSAYLVYSHHRGLRNWKAEFARKDLIFRDKKQTIRDTTDRELPNLIQLHRQLTDSPEIEPDSDPQGDYSVFMRMALSCIADADHSDTAQCYGKPPCDDDSIPLRAKERLDKLDAYVQCLEDDSERNSLRREMYFNCRNAAVNGGFVCCDSSVGTGKTTAAMAHLLNQAIKRGSRRVFVILPQTNIINQSVSVYRKALVLPGEDPETVVAELHHRADFEHEDTRRLTALWRAPIIVTTAVSFFETLASNRPSSLRKLHELPNSVVFIDEAHAALPVNLLPLVWRWMNVLEQEWGCYWLLASGSLVRFWEIKELTERHPRVEELVDAELSNRLKSFESRRVSFLYREKPLSRHELTEWITSQSGPRLVIMNTVQSAAVIADELRTRFGRSTVEHLSSALTPEDREATLRKIKTRLDNKTDSDWTLVATSCVEAGVDISFRTGFRETSSLLSLLQASGRISRGGEYPNAKMWSFSMQDDRLLIRNPAIRHSAEILTGYFRKGLVVDQDLCTKAIHDELIQYDEDIIKRKQLSENEEALAFEDVADQFKVIDSDTVPVLIDPNIARQFEVGGGDWRLLQKKSVSIARLNLVRWKARKLSGGLYQWTLPYDDFIGIMAGVIRPASGRTDSP